MSMDNWAATGAAMSLTGKRLEPMSTVSILAKLLFMLTGTLTPAMTPVTGMLGDAADAVEMTNGMTVEMMVDLDKAMVSASSSNPLRIGMLAASESDRHDGKVATTPDSADTGG